ncbi:hypothetical protein WJX73_004445 [Symbiochloris irregularis]|uniref:Peptidase M48 domain-containing protein n=1 Tax=Symbiochloris irregularis TaxID=706552 RepID=A0AAW1PHM0_9CHLO
MLIAPALQPAHHQAFFSCADQTVASPFTALPIAIGSAGAFLAGYGVDGAILGAVGGVALRAFQALVLEQTVPFTYRRHTVVLPVGIELLMGDLTFKQQIGQYEQAGRVLPQNASESQLVRKIADRIIDAVQKQYGGGYQKHIPDFKWSITVVNDKTPNAFVLPGGKIVVFTGLIKLLDGREDLLAAVIGHEVAHAVARHSGEKLSVQLAVTIALNVGLAALQFYRNRQQQQSGRQQQGWGSQQQRRGGYGNQRYRGMGGGGGPGGLLFSPQVVSLFANLFLQLPFSRRAEAEADLIGLKLMALAGYDPKAAPDTFRKLGQAEQSMRAAMGGNLGALQCTHPRSETRVQLLEEELQNMREVGDAALSRVVHKVPYWML